jgi:4-amino-4-deoxy-L-arabinose transferase-like glycosyltransferase
MQSVRIRRHAALLAVAGLSLLAFALRLSGMDQSLFGDEEILFRVVHDRAFGDVLEVVHDTESTPPLHFLLAWASAQIGDPTVWVRLPSVLLGTATVPLVYLLGARTLGRSAGLVGAALVAIAPYAIFYGIEARAYATLGFLAILSTLALLAATRSGRPRWWVAFAVTTCALLYTHYTAIFLIAAQIAWALLAFPRRWRAILLSTGAAALLYLPWIPSFLVQRRDSAEQRYTEADSLGEAITRLLQVIPGHPFARLSEIPGQPWLAMLAAVLAVATALAAWRVVARWRGAGRPVWHFRVWRAAIRRLRAGESVWPSPEIALITLLAVAAPTGVILYSLGPTSIFAQRSMVTSLPAICVAIGGLLTRLRAPLSAVAVALFLLALGAGAVQTLSANYQRPPLHEIAEFVDEAAGPGDAVLNQAPSSSPSLDALLWHGQRVFTGNLDDPAPWRYASRGGSVFLIRYEVGLAFGLPRLAGPGNRFLLREGWRYPSFVPVSVGRYMGELKADLGRRNGQEVIRWSLGEDVEISPRAALGSVDSVSTSGKRITIKGWAIDSRRRAAADWVVAFTDGRLIGVERPRVPRPDVMKAYGKAALVSGFALTVQATNSTRLVNPSNLRVIAVVANSASDIRGEGRAPRATRFRFHSETKLTSRAGQQVLVLTKGRRIPLSDGAVSGYIDSVVAKGRTLTVRGWAADISRQRIADRVFVFANGQPLVAGAPAVERSDVALAHGPLLLGVGFRLSVVTPRAKQFSDLDRLRVVALSDSRASELAGPESPGRGK